MSQPKSFLLDMDGVLVKGHSIIPGADRFIERLNVAGSPYLVLTNNPIYTPRDLAHRLRTAGLRVGEDHIFTSALATAMFLKKQKPGGTAFVIGESGLTQAIYEAGYVITDRDPDYVVLGETLSYNVDLITTAVRLVVAGANFIATNPDASGTTENGVVPACGAMAALIEKASGISPFFVGKPNPLMMRTALDYLDVHSDDAIMVGDRMDTDIIAGVESGVETILVLTGVTEREQVAKYAYQPTRILKSVADIDP